MEQRYSSTLSLTLALYESGLSTPCPSQFTPGKGLVPIVNLTRVHVCVCVGVCVYIYTHTYTYTGISNDLQNLGPDRQKQMTLLFISYVFHFFGI